MANNPKQQHRGHPKRITALPNGGTGPGRHYGRIDCVLCGKFIAWATEQQINNFKEKYYGNSKRCDQQDNND